MMARRTVWAKSEARLTPCASRDSVEKTMDAPTRKRKVGKDQVGGGEAVPLRVLQGPEGAVAAVVVHQDHEGDGEAAQQVDGEIPLRR